MSRADGHVFQSVLLVEDEQALGAAIEIALKRSGIPRLARATHLAQARELLESFEPELVILDRKLPDGDGITLCPEIRAANGSTAILMLTAQGGVKDRVQGLESGADDYLAKPFAWEELHARIQALHRRLHPATPTTAAKKSKNKEAALWHCDPERLRILGPRGWETLTPLEYKLSQHLISAGGSIVSREELLKEVWGFRFLPKTRTVDYFMGRLRKRFEEDADRPRHFLTVRGAGYRFSEVPESDPTG